MINTQVDNVVQKVIFKNVSVLCDFMARPFDQYIGILEFRDFNIEIH